MTPEQKIMHLVLTQAAADEVIDLDDEITSENVDDFYGELTETSMHQDYLYEIREGQVETEIPCQSSRHYESKSVAAKMPDGSWVGWTYWYGGGKHGEPEAIDWMNEAYFLDCKEEEKVVTIQTFTRKEPA